jgi:hypothetical protein
MTALALRLNILPYHFNRRIANGTTEIAVAPKRFFLPKMLF